MSVKPSLVYNNSSADNQVEMRARLMNKSQKVLLSFCISVPPSRGLKDNIFKNSRLLLHEILMQEGEKSTYEVVKITRCKMRQTNTLEIEIGLKSLWGQSQNYERVTFENRVFMLKFLNKLDPALSCKGRIIITGKDLMDLQEQQITKDRQAGLPINERDRIIEILQNDKKSFENHDSERYTGTFGENYHPKRKLNRDAPT